MAGNPARVATKTTISNGNRNGLKGCYGDASGYCFAAATTAAASERRGVRDRLSSPATTTTTNGNELQRPYPSRNNESGATAEGLGAVALPGCYERKHLGGVLYVHGERATDVVGAVPQKDKHVFAVGCGSEDRRGTTIPFDRRGPGGETVARGVL